MRVTYTCHQKSNYKESTQYHWSKVLCFEAADAAAAWRTGTLDGGVKWSDAHLWSSENQWKARGESPVTLNLYTLPIIGSVIWKEVASGWSTAATDADAEETAPPPQATNGASDSATGSATETAPASRLSVVRERGGLALGRRTGRGVLKLAAILLERWLLLPRVKLTPPEAANEGLDSSETFVLLPPAKSTTIQPRIECIL